MWITMLWTSCVKALNYVFNWQVSKLLLLQLISLPITYSFSFILFQSLCISRMTLKKSHQKKLLFFCFSIVSHFSHTFSSSPSFQASWLLSLLFASLTLHLATQYFYSSIIMLIINSLFNRAFSNSKRIIVLFLLLNSHNAINHQANNSTLPANTIFIRI